MTVAHGPFTSTNGMIYYTVNVYVPTERTDDYRSTHAPRLQAEHTERYGTRVTATRTVHVAEQQ
ncbi:MAG: DUF4286 family protein [Candidatus Kapabacteria bacterium]|nr:DUF4286 family protein [Candidatus Kapabacteria bacterium]